MFTTYPFVGWRRIIQKIVQSVLLKSLPPKVDTRNSFFKLASDVSGLHLIETSARDSPPVSFQRVESTKKGIDVKQIVSAFLERNKLNRKLHWTTIASEKALLAVIGILTLVASADSIWGMWIARRVELSDLFLLFIYVEIIGMVGAFYSTNRIPVTLPMIIAITALCRLIVMQSKSAEPLTLLAEAGAILVLSVAAYVMSLKDKVSLEKLESRHLTEKDSS